MIPDRPLSDAQRRILAVAGRPRRPQGSTLDEIASAVYANGGYASLANARRAVETLRNRGLIVATGATQDGESLFALHKTG